MTSRIRVEPPNQLPSTGLTSIQYKQWKVALKIFLQQTAEYREYFPGGLYPTWTPMEDNPNRISKLKDDDKPDGTTAKEHLAQRNIHLETFLGIIARYSDEGDFDDILEKSSSLEWIHQLHERRYGIQRKGRYFHRMDSIRFDKATMTDYYKFYSDLRSCFKSNLMKSGDTVKYKQQTLKEDEKISPTTECLLIQIALERIDQRLPAEIDRIFGHRMNDGTTLMDLHTEIFSYIPRELASLDREENIACSACHMHQNDTDIEQETVNINAMSYRNPRMQTRSANRQPAKFHGGATKQTNFRNKNCKICEALELPPSVCNSHNSNECRKKTLLQELFMEMPNNDYNTEHANHQED